MKRLGLCVLLVACGDNESAPQASRTVEPASADALPAAVRDMKFVAEVDAAPAANVEVRPDAAVEEVAKPKAAKKPKIGDGDPRPGFDMPGQKPKLPDISDAARLPQFRFKLASKQALDATSLPVETVVNKIHSVYMASLKRCYARTWQVDPTAAGALRLAFSVDATGRVTDASATGPAATLDACLEGAMPNWTFPVPNDAAGAPVSARFEVGFEIRID